MFELCWNGDGIRGCKDFIPQEWFEQEVNIPEVPHFVFFADSGLWRKAVCSVAVGRTIATLSYGGRHTDVNVAAEMDPGVMRISFADKTRTRIKLIEWRDPQDRDFTARNISVKYLLDIKAVEGDILRREQNTRKRDRAIRKAKIKHVLGKGQRLSCEACDFDFENKYGSLGKETCEVHHRTTISSGEQTTSLEDLAIVCSNCHTILHRPRAKISVQQLKVHVQAVRAGS